MAEAGVSGVIIRGALLSAVSPATGQLAPLSFFAPNCQIFNDQDPSTSLKSLIKEAHAHSMEVFLEVSFLLLML